MVNDTFRGRTAIVGVGETNYYRWGRSPDAEFKLTLDAILAACRDTGIDPRDIDGFASFSNDRNLPARLAAALDIRELRHASMVWGGGGGGGAAAVTHAAASVAAGLARFVVVYRGLAQGQFQRFGRGGGAATVSGEFAFTHPYGLMVPAQMYAMKFQRWMYENGGRGAQAQKAVSLTSYAHAQNNPRAVMAGKPLTAEKYDEARWIVEPWRLYDCCQENDGAAAVIITSAETARSLPHPPAYILAATQGSDNRYEAWSHNAPGYGSSNFRGAGPRLFASAGVKPTDVDVAQSYENFTGGVVMSLVEHGFCMPEEVDDFLTVSNLSARGGALPLNTSGGNLAECYMHGVELIVEGVRQIRGSAVNQVPDVDVSFVSSGPMVTPVSNLVLGSEQTL
jgi:acetyl-CoA acetyltransferase